MRSCGDSSRWLILGLLLAGGEGRRMGGRNKGLLLLDGWPLAWHVWQRLYPAIHALGGQMLVSANRQMAEYTRWLGVMPMPDAMPWQGMGPLAALATLAEHGRRADVPAHTLVQLVPCDTPHIPLDMTQRLLQPLCDREHRTLSAAVTPVRHVARNRPSSASDPVVPDVLGSTHAPYPGMSAVATEPGECHAHGGVVTWRTVSGCASQAQSIDGGGGHQQPCLAAYPEVPGQGVHPTLALVRWAAVEQVADYLRAGGRSVRGWLQQVGAQPVPFADAAAFANANTPQALQELQAQQGTTDDRADGA